MQCNNSSFQLCLFETIFQFILGLINLFLTHFHSCLIWLSQSLLQSIHGAKCLNCIFYETVPFVLSSCKFYLLICKYKSELILIWYTSLIYCLISYFCTNRFMAETLSVPRVVWCSNIWLHTCFLYCFLEVIAKFTFAKNIVH